MKHLSIIFLIFNLGLKDVKAQFTNSEIIYNAYISNNMSIWKKVSDEMQKNQTHSNELVLNLINIQYGYIAYCIKNGQNEIAITYLKLAEENLNLIEMGKYKLSLVSAYRSVFLSFRAGINKKEALNYSIKSLNFAEKAIKQDSTNYFAFMQRANIYRYTPKAFNGSKIKAIEYYLKAETLIKKEIGFNKKNWNYLHLLVTITETYIDLKDFKSAKNYCEKILKIEPKYTFIKDVLYPKLEIK
jgi:tetratricopeptide (TPR) repeat protein